MYDFFLKYLCIGILVGGLAIVFRSNIVFLSVFIVSLIMIIAALSLTIVKTVTGMRNSLNEIVNGQLNISIKKSKINVINSVGQKINEYLVKIRNLVCQYQNFSEKTIKESHSIREQAESLRNISGEIALTVQNIAETVNSEAESTGKVIEDINIFNQSLGEIYENAKISSNVAKDSKIIVDDSFKTFEETFIKVDEIRINNDKVLEDMTHLDKSIKQISVITETVESIASQTRLLALNASIEAARAGEAGKGFAVVAGEVSKLADDSSKSAKEIKSLIDGITGEINQLTNNISIQTDIIKNNVNFARIALDKSEEINKAVNENMKAADEIVRLTEKQKEKIIGITDSMGIINDSTQQNAAVSEEISASTQEQLSIIETIYDAMVGLNNAIEYSNNIIDKFLGGFKITDDIKKKVERTKSLVTEISTSKEVLNLKGEKLQEYLIAKQKSVDFIELISFISKKGRQEVTTEDVPEEHRDVSARPYFLKAIAGETFISKEYISTFSNHYNITICMPIFENGATVGAILADINLNEN